jgi:Rieske Fe-S protein
LWPITGNGEYDLENCCEARMARVSPGTHRRRFLGFFTNLLMAMIGAAVALPAVAYFTGPLRRKTETGGPDADFHDAGPLSNIPVKQWRLLSLEMVHQDGWKRSSVRHAIWVCREDESAQGVKVLSSICPHLGCPINWHPDQTEFLCPCHGAIFNREGERKAGPPPRAMDPLDFDIRAGHLWVRWQDFKIGVADRVPVSV